MNRSSLNTERWNSPPRRLYVIDDHPAFLTTVALVIDATPGVELVETAPSGGAALAYLSDGLADHPVDVILVDVVMGEMTGPQFAARYRAGGGTASIVFMSSYDQDDLAHLIGPDDVFLAKNDLSPQRLTTMLNLDSRRRHYAEASQRHEGRGTHGVDPYTARNKP